MLELAIAFGAGLLVGWNVLPQPQWIANTWNRYFGG